MTTARSFTTRFVPPSRWFGVTMAGALVFAIALAGCGSGSGSGDGGDAGNANPDGGRGGRGGQGAPPFRKTCR